ncbi:hypothetical protein BC829DRAFT_230222 [Chytridium lagenaria]|nr:hypothetical protein BC829DRAFT_230222 [Chytridium lagenaria]
MQPKARVAIADLVSKSNERSRSLEGNIAFKVKAFLSRQEVTSTENGQADSDILKTHAVKKVETKKEQNEREKGRRKKNLEMTAPSVISSRDGGQASEGIGLAAYSTSGPITPKILKPPTKRIKATASTPAKASIATSTSHQRTHPMTDTNVKEAKIKAAASTPAKASIVASTLHQRTHPMTDTNMKAAFDKRPVEGMASPPQQLIQEKPKTTLSSIKAELHTKEELQQVKVNATEVIPPKAPLKKQHRDYNIDGSQRQFSGKPIAVPTTRSESNTEDCIVKYAFCPTSPPEYANVGELDAVDQRRLTLVQGIVSPPKRPMQGKPNIALSSIKSELRTRKELQDELTTPVIPPGTASKKQVRDYNVNGCQRQIPGKPISIPTTRSESDTEDCVVKYVSLPPTSPIFEIDKHSVKYSVPTLGGSWTPKEWILSRGAELEEEGVISRRANMISPPE